MKKEKIIVIGANHAGTSFIRTIGQIAKDKFEIVAYDKNDNISFLGCGIALWVGNEFDNPDGLFYSNKNQLENDYGAKINMSCEVVSINQKNKTITIKNLKTNENFEDSFDKLIFAGGTWPLELNVKGANLENIYFSKLFQHAKLIQKANQDKNIKNVAIIGAGFIGIELAEAFYNSGKHVILIDSIDHVIGRYFDKELTDPLEEEIIKNGIELKNNEFVQSFEGVNNKVSKVITNKNSYDVDLVISAIGFVPQTQIFKGELDTIKNGALIVNEFQQTTNRDIYALGDSCALKHTVLGLSHVALATNAIKTGIVAALHISGTNIPFPGVNGTNAINVFNFKYASTGITEEVAKHFNIEHKAITIFDKDKPEFMKSSNNVTFKIIYNPKNFQILGAQVGSKKEPHTEIINMISLAILKKITIPELALNDVYFLPHFNKPFNFVLKALLEALGLKY